MNYMNKTGINIRNLNKEVSPKSDFYEYACGGWIKDNPMPDEFSSYGTFNVLQENAKKQLKELIINLGSTPEAQINGTVAQKISDLYNLGMDEKRLNREGNSPIQPTLEKLKGYVAAGDFTNLIAWLHSGLDATFFGSGVGPDPSDSNTNMMHITETGLGLGDRDYYLEDNETNRKILKAYEDYVKKIMMLACYEEKDAERKK